MGKTLRWLRRLFGIRIQDDNNKQQHQLNTLWRFGKSRRESQVIEDAIDPKKHAIVTEGIANAAVSTAKATVAMISLRNSGMIAAGATGCNDGIGLEIRECAAVKIQSHFRGYLAKKALRALKGLVKLQALVRGYIIRKQTAEMLSRFQSLLRVQTRAKLSRAQVSHLPHCALAKLAQTKTGPLLRRNGSKSVRRVSDPDNTLNHRKWNNNNTSLSLSTSNNSTGQDHLVPSPTTCEIQSAVNFKTKESTPFCTPSNSPMMMCYSSSDYGDFDNHPSYMAYTESSKAKMRSFSAPKQRMNNQFERVGSIKRHLVYNGTSPSSYTNFSNKVYPSSCRLDRVVVPILRLDPDLLRK